MKIALLLLPVATLLSGCVLLTRTPADLASITREHASSSKVMVQDFKLVRYEGQLLLVGKVGRAYFDADTSQTHLDVTLFAADDSVLRAITTEFNPRQVLRGRRMPVGSTYQVVLDPLPPGLARVQVRAHEGEHLPSSRPSETQSK